MRIRSHLGTVARDPLTRTVKSPEAPRNAPWATLSDLSCACGSADGLALLRQFWRVFRDRKSWIIPIPYEEALRSRASHDLSA